jgi:hypothetical protein
VDTFSDTATAAVTPKFVCQTLKDVWKNGDSNLLHALKEICDNRRTNTVTLGRIAALVKLELLEECGEPHLVVREIVAQTLSYGPADIGSRPQTGDGTGILFQEHKFRPEALTPIRQAHSVPA